MTVWATRCTDGKVDPEVLADVVRRVVDAASPEKIVLFGSAARGEMGPNSDIDLLVVKDTTSRAKEVEGIYARLWGVEAAVDVVMVTPREVASMRTSHALVVKPALQEGRVVYER